ncbi:MAG: Cytochrome c oxidase subunit 6A, mitochondrial [Chrysothrix sp. TS-e1954]|nr:MAG: Cytochrome c oxidase subunit 6A, mitochondrial [Chrysothrix sp. TS-e1954]
MTSRLGLRPATLTRNFQQLRQTTARRWRTQPASTGHTVDKLEGVWDNAFNRERLAVKKHAAATSNLWRRLSLYVVIPCLIVATANTLVRWTEHWEHQSHMPPIHLRKEYSYMNIRTKAYPWGDGDKTLFWNDNYNYHHKDE